MTHPPTLGLSPTAPARDTGSVLTRLVPTVFYKDVSVGLDLFVDGLAFTPVHEDGGLHVLEREGVKVQLSQDPRAARHSERPELGLETDDIDAFFEEVSTRRPDLLHPNLPTPRERPWGAKEFAVLDATTVCVVVRQWVHPGDAG